MSTVNSLLFTVFVVKNVIKISYTQNCARVFLIFLQLFFRAPILLGFLPKNSTSRIGIGFKNSLKICPLVTQEGSILFTAIRATVMCFTRRFFSAATVKSV